MRECEPCVAICRGGRMDRPGDLPKWAKMVTDFCQ